MSRYDQKFKPYCPNCRTLRIDISIPYRVMAEPVKINRQSVDYLCSRCGHTWRSRAKFALREIERHKRAKQDKTEDSR